LNIAFRLEASSKIGVGHLMRCLALSEELTRKNHKCIFIINKIDEIVKEKMEQFRR
jgi:spore coat polysaccharide biosynthesis predicted glycosyltransferase SpsG